MLQRARPFIGTGILFVVFCIFAYIGFKDQAVPENDIATSASQTQRLEGRIIRVDEKVHRRDVTIETNRGRVLARLRLHHEVTTHDGIHVTCDLERVEPFDGFRYDRYLALRNIFAICEHPSDMVILPHTSSPRTWLSDGRHALISRLRSLLPEPEASLAAGLLFGGTHGMSDTAVERFRVTGTSHIIAASGYNVAIVAQFALSTLMAIGVHRKKAVIATLGLIFLYVVMAGAESSLLRAGIMGSILLIARHIGRKIFWLNVLLLAAVAMAAIHPQIIWDDVGYQLSFVAVLGLLYLTPILEKYATWIPQVLGLRENVTTTVAATLSALPIVWVIFGRVAFRGLFVNVLVLPFIPIAMVTSIIALAMSGIGVPQIATLIAWFPLHLILTIIRLTAGEFDLNFL